MAKKDTLTAEAEPDTGIVIDVTATIENAEPTQEGADTSWTWPDAKQKENLFVEFSEHDKSEIATELSEKILRCAAAKAHKSAVTKRLQADIDELDLFINTKASDLERGGTERTVECAWTFETRLDNGELVPDKEFKTLVRQDTFEAVRSERISDEERQATLFLSDEEKASHDADGLPTDEQEQPDEEGEPV
jgi:hypothetical protein